MIWSFTQLIFQTFRIVLNRSYKNTFINNKRKRYTASSIGMVVIRKPIFSALLYITTGMEVSSPFIRKNGTREMSQDIINRPTSFSNEVEKAVNNKKEAANKKLMKVYW